jgi:hypothetical protein
VTLTDASLEEEFTVAAAISFNFENIGAGESEVVNATVVPKSSGALGVGAATVTYQATSEGEKQVRGPRRPRVGPATSTVHRFDP